MSETKRLLEKRISEDATEVIESESGESSPPLKVRHRQAMSSEPSTSAGLGPSTTYGTLHSSGLKRSLLVTDHYPRTHFTRKQFVIAAISVVLFVAAVTVTLVLGLPRLEAKRDEYFAAKFVESDLEEVPHVRHTVVVSGSDQPQCADVGHQMLGQNGSAIDAALAVLFCTQLASPHLVSLTTGFSMLYHSNSNSLTYSIEAPEQRVQLNSHWLTLPSLPQMARSVHRRFGKVPWSKVVQPSVKLANEGSPVSEDLSSQLKAHQSRMQNLLKPIRDLFIKVDRNASTEQWLQKDDLYRNPALAQTLQTVAESGSTPSEDLVHDIHQILLSQEPNSTVSVEEIREMLNATREARVTKPRRMSLMNQSMTVLVGSDGGVAVAQLLTLIERLLAHPDSNFEQCNDDNRSILEGAYEFHYVIEALKYASVSLLQLNNNSTTAEKVLDQSKIYQIASDMINSVQQKNYLHEPSYYGFGPSLPVAQVESGHNVQIIVYDQPTGDVVTLTTTESRPLFTGLRKVISNQTGIVLDLTNSLPVLQPAVAPMLILDQSGRVQLASGGTGGSGHLGAIAAALAQVLYKVVLNCQTLKTAVDESRFFFQPSEQVELYEPELPQIYVDYLGRMFQHYELKPTTLESGWSDPAVFAVFRVANQTTAGRSSSIGGELLELRAMLDYRQEAAVQGE